MNSNKNKQWYAAEIRLAPQAVEAVEFALTEAGASGTEFITLGKKEPGETVCVTGYFDDPPDRERLEFEISNSLRIYDLPPDAVRGTEYRAVENQDWLAEWKKHWRPTETGKFIVAPAWQEVETADKIVIRIDPSMAFGTGTHETTRLCLKAIEENLAPEMSFLDVGTGTGILAIAAAKLKNETKNDASAPAILACDTDPDSIVIARENAEANRVAASIEFYVGSISDETPGFDFVCANLTADVIVPLLPLLVEKSRQFLVLSGILKEQEELIKAELKKAGVENPHIETDGEWISVTIKSGKLLI